MLGTWFADGLLWFSLGTAVEVGGLDLAGIMYGAIEPFFKNGKLKAIGAAARQAIAEHLGRKVHLFLHVKVNPRWDEDRGLYRDIGLEWTE